MRQPRHRPTPDDRVRIRSDPSGDAAEKGGGGPAPAGPAKRDPKAEIDSPLSLSISSGRRSMRGSEISLGSSRVIVVLVSRVNVDVVASPTFKPPVSQVRLLLMLACLLASGG